MSAFGSSIAEVDSLTLHDEREASLSSRLASLNIPDDTPAGLPMRSAATGGGAAAGAGGADPYILSSTMQAALHQAEARRLEEEYRAKEAALKASAASVNADTTR